MRWPLSFQLCPLVRRTLFGRVRYWSATERSWASIGDEIAITRFRLLERERSAQ